MMLSTIEEVRVWAEASSAKKHEEWNKRVRKTDYNEGYHDGFTDVLNDILGLLAPLKPNSDLLKES